MVDISFKINNILALIGESGSGKSLTLKAILGMLPSNLIVEFEYDFHDTLQRGKNISFVPQNPFTALSPLTKIVDQFFIKDDEVLKYFEMVGLDKSILNKYPPSLSGGQLQRVIIAQAISSQSKIILFDEPTTALDSQNVKNILLLIQQLQKKLGFLALYVTHDINSVKSLAQDVAVLKDGKIIEYNTINNILINPKDKYTKQLIDASFENRAFRE